MKIPSGSFAQFFPESLYICFTTAIHSLVCNFSLALHFHLHLMQVGSLRQADIAVDRRICLLPLEMPLKMAVGPGQGRQPRQVPDSS